MIVSTALLCMALTIYHEARGELVPGQYAVAQVLWRRAGEQRREVCVEAFAAKQFSWANRGVKRVAGGWQLAPQHLPTDEFAWRRAKRIAQVVMGGVADFTRGQADHYHRVDVRPVWRLSMQETWRIGRHVFYRS